MKPFTRHGCCGSISTLMVTMAAALCSGICQPAFAQAAAPAAVRVDAARVKTVQEQRLVTGELRPVRRAQVAAEEAGSVQELPIIEGQVVKQGDVLARLDSTRLTLELQQLEAEEQVALATLDERRADARWRELDLENYRTLSRGGATNVKELYDAESQYRIAEARVAAAERQVQVIRARADLLRQRLEDMTVRAPFDGVVVARHTDLGEWLALGSPVAELVSINELDAWLDVPQDYADAILGRRPTVTITIDATKRVIESDNIRIVPQISPNARTFSVVVRLDNADGLLAPGMSLTAWVPTGDLAERMTVPRDAVVRNDTGMVVYVVRSASPDGPALAMPAAVRVLFGWGKRFVVQAASLIDGDMVVVEGNERLPPNTPVLPIHDAEQ